MIVDNDGWNEREQREYDESQRGLVGREHDWRVTPNGDVVLNYHNADELERLAKRAVAELIRLEEEAYYIIGLMLAEGVSVNPGESAAEAVGNYITITRNKDRKLAAAEADNKRLSALVSEAEALMSLLVTNGALPVKYDKGARRYLANCNRLITGDYEPEE